MSLFLHLNTYIFVFVMQRLHKVHFQWRTRVDFSFELHKKSALGSLIHNTTAYSVLQPRTCRRNCVYFKTTRFTGAAGRTDVQEYIWIVLWSRELGFDNKDLVFLTWWLRCHFDGICLFCSQAYYISESSFTVHWSTVFFSVTSVLLRKTSSRLCQQRPGAAFGEPAEVRGNVQKRERASENRANETQRYSTDFPEVRMWSFWKVTRRLF